MSSKVFTISGRRVTVYEAAHSAPIVYFNADRGEAEQVHAALKDAECPEHTLVTVNVKSWNDDLSPWKADAVFKGGQPFGGRADDYLDSLTDAIIPGVESELMYSPTARFIAGYSLAGLFSLYSLYRTDIFDGAASVSGSLWYPGFLEYTHTHEMIRRPECVYFSLGDRESRTKNPVMSTVQEKTEELEAELKNQGISTVFELNPGNHFVDSDMRTARGITWIIRSQLHIG